MTHINSPLITSRQFIICAIMGAILWFLAAMLCHYLGTRGVYEGIGRVILYVLIIPGTVPFVLLIQKLAGLTRRRLALGISVGTTAAVLLDGIALAWIPALYGGTPYMVAGAGATILWGAGIGMAIALYLSLTAKA